MISLTKFLLPLLSTSEIILKAKSSGNSGLTKAQNSFGPW